MEQIMNEKMKEQINFINRFKCLLPNSPETLFMTDQFVHFNTIKYNCYEYANKYIKNIITNESELYELVSKMTLSNYKFIDIRDFNFDEGKTIEFVVFLLENSEYGGTEHVEYPIYLSLPENIQYDLGMIKDILEVYSKDIKIEIENIRKIKENYLPSDIV